MGMSIFSATRRIGASTLFDIQQDCVLCDASAAAVICEDCRVALPNSDLACPVCAAPGSSMVCGGCLSEPPQFDATIAAFEYAFPLDRLVQALKFSANLSLVDFFSEALANKLRTQTTNSHPDVIVALPLAPKRLAARGFNQSALVADRVSKLLSIPVAHTAMLRIRETPPQAGLSRDQRRRNIRGAFDCALPLDGKYIAIVDDVLTTGATLSEAAKVLKKAGATRVDAWVLSRAVTTGK